MKNVLRILSCAIAVVAAVSLGPSGSALPTYSDETIYYNGSNCPADEIGYFIRDCSGAHDESGEVDGPNATYKIVTTYPCHSGAESTQMYSKECGAWVANNRCYHICELRKKIPLTFAAIFRELNQPRG